MGNTFNDQQSKYQFVGERKDKKYGPIKLWQLGSSVVIQKELRFNQYLEKEDFLNQCSNVVNLSHPSLIQLIHYEDAYANQANIYLEYYNCDLQKEILSRSMNQESFSQEEMTSLVTNMIQVGSYLQGHCIYHGDLKSSNILLNDQGVPKIIDYGLVHPFKSGPIKTLHIQDKTYFSPELLDCIRQKETHPYINYHKNDVFTLGMTFLEASTLTSLFSCYSKIILQRLLIDWQALTINQNILKELIEQMKQQYNPFISGLICMMLQFNPEARPDFIQLENLLNNPTYQIPNRYDVQTRIATEEQKQLYSITNIPQRVQIKPTQSYNPIQPPPLPTQNPRFLDQSARQNSFYKLQDRNINPQIHNLQYQPQYREQSPQNIKFLQAQKSSQRSLSVHAQPQQIVRSPERNRFQLPPQMSIQSPDKQQIQFSPQRPINYIQPQIHRKSPVQDYIQPQIHRMSPVQARQGGYYTFGGTRMEGQPIQNSVPQQVPSLRSLQMPPLPNYHQYFDYKVASSTKAQQQKIELTIKEPIFNDSSNFTTAQKKSSSVLELEERVHQAIQETKRTIQRNSQFSQDRRSKLQFNQFLIGQQKQDLDDI